MVELDEEILKAIRRTPDMVSKPDGTQEPWTLKKGSKSWTKQYILENWKKDKEMTATVTQIYMDQITHLAGRAPP